MATGGSVDGSDEIIDIKCCVCDKKRIRREADKYCVECQNYYCASCADMHKMFLPNAGGHKLLDKADFGSTGLRSGLPIYPTERCGVHNAKILDMYCKDHDEVICSTCVAMSHRTCRHIHSIPDEMDTLYEPAASGDLRKGLTKAKKVMEEIKKSNETYLRELYKFKKNATNSIKDYRKEIEAVLDRLESESAKEIELIYGNIERSLKKDIKEAEDYATSLEQSLNRLKKSGENKAQEFINMKTAKKNIDKATQAKKRSILNKSRKVEIPFQADPNIKGFLQELKKLGQVDATKFPTTPKPTVYNVKSVKHVDILNDQTPINGNLGSCFTSDGLLLLSVDDGKCLKRIDLSSELVLDTLNLEFECVGVCMTNLFEAAVCTRNKSIQFVSLGKKMTTAQQLKVNHHCFGIACDNNRLFVSDSGNALYIHDMKGNMLKKVTGDRTGASIFSSIRHVTVFGDRVYVADQDRGVVTLDTVGNYKSTFEKQDLIRAFAVCTDKRGNIFVCGLGLSKVVQLSEDPLSVVSVLDDSIYATSACFDQHQNRLVVTVFNGSGFKILELE